MDNRPSARDRNQGIWIEPTDRLYCAAYSSVASLVVLFSGYFRTAKGEIGEYAVAVNPTSDRAVTEVDVHFGAGFLLSCVARLISGNASRGQCYTRARIQRSTGTPLLVLHSVLAGYLTDEYTPSFPYGVIEGPLSGPGMFRSIAGTNPAANAEISETVPTGARWKLHSMMATLVADANAANRSAQLVIDDGTNVVLRSAPALTQTATQTIIYNWTARGAAGSVAALTASELIPPDLYLPAGYRINTLTNNLQATDDWGAPRLYVEEWIEA
jgi:hypothetical protein